MQCQDDRYSVVVEVDGENWQAAAQTFLGAIGKLQPMPNAPAKSPPAEDLLDFQLLEVELGPGLVRLVDSVLSGISELRKQLARSLGFVLPSVRIRDSAGLATSGYRVMVRGQEKGTGDTYPDYMLALGPEPSLEGTAAVDPVSGAAALLVPIANKEAAQKGCARLVPAAMVIVNHLAKIARANADALLTRQATQELIDRLKRLRAALVEQTIPVRVTPERLQAILRRLLTNEICLLDMELIVETLAAQPDGTREEESAREVLQRLAPVVSPPRETGQSAGG